LFYYDIDYIESKTITVGKQYFKQKVGCCYIVEIVVPTIRYILYKLNAVYSMYYVCIHVCM